MLSGDPIRCAFIQAVFNFAMEQKAGEMQELVGVFRKQWEQFTEKINAMGKSIGALTNHYDELKGPRFRALENLWIK